MPISRRLTPPASTIIENCLKRNDLDAILIATPDPWHSAIDIDALNSGKDVCVEKPLRRTIEEGQQIVKAAPENKRVCRQACSNASASTISGAKEKYFDSGKIGSVALAHT